MIQLYIEDSKGARYTVRAGHMYKASPGEKVNVTEFLGMFDSNTLQLVYDQYLGAYITRTPGMAYEKSASYTSPSDPPGYLNERDKAIYRAILQSRLVIEEAPLPHSALADLQTELVAKIRMGLHQVIVKEDADTSLNNESDCSYANLWRTMNILKYSEKTSSFDNWRLPIWSRDFAKVEAMVTPARQSFELSTEAINYVLYDEGSEKVHAECATLLYRGLVEILGFNSNSVSKKQLHLSFNIAEVIYSDQTLQEAVSRFAKDYVKTKYRLSITESNVGGVFEVILTIALSALTKGDVSANSLAKNIRLVNSFRKIGNLMFEFARLKRQRKLLTEVSNNASSKKRPVLPNIRISQVSVNRLNSKGSSRNSNSGHFPSHTYTNLLNKTPKEDSSLSSNELNCTKDISEDVDITCNEVGVNYNNDNCQNTINKFEVGRSVNLKTGEVQITVVDAVLGGPLPLFISRTYRSSNLRDSGLGYGWTHTFSERLVWRPGKSILFFNAEGRIISIPAPGNSCCSHNIFEKITLTRVNDEHWVISRYGVPNGAQKHFKAIGETGALKISEIRDCHNNFYLFHYSDDVLASIESSFGETIIISSSGESPESLHVNTITKDTHFGNSKILAQYTFDSENNLIKAVDKSGNSEKYEYHNNIITQRVLKTGYRLHFQWKATNPFARCIRQWGDPIAGKATCSYQFSWDDDNYGVTVSDIRGGSQYFRFNEYAQLTYYRDAEGGETLNSYNEQGQVTRVMLRNNNDTVCEELFRYDKQTRLINTADVTGNNYHLEYDEKGRLKKISAPFNNTWLYSYNKQGQISTVKDSFNNNIRYNYTSSGLLGTITNSDGKTNRYLWSAGRKLLKIVEHLNYSFNYRHINDDIQSLIKGNSVEEIDCGYGVLTLANTVVADGDNKADYSFNHYGMLEEITDEFGAKTVYTYDALLQVETRTNSDGGRLEYSYDGERNLIGLKNEKGQSYRLKYDLNNRLIEEVDFDGCVTRYVYNCAGHLVTVTLIACIQGDEEIDVHFERDRLGRLLKESSKEGISKFRYDCTGNLISAENRHCKLRWEYDNDSRVIAEWQGANKLSHQYDMAGNRISTTLPDGKIYKLPFDNASGLLNYFSDRNNNIQSAPNAHADLCENTHKQPRGSLDLLKNYDPQSRVQGISVRAPNKYSEFSLDCFGIFVDLFFKLDPALEAAAVKDSLPDVCSRHRNILGQYFDGGLNLCKFDPANFIFSCSHLDNWKHFPTKNFNKNGNGCKNNTIYNCGQQEPGVEDRRAEGAPQQLRYHYNYRQQLVRVDEIRVEKGVEKFHDIILYQYDPLGRCVEKNSFNENTKFLWSDTSILQEL
ncbi:DUF6531 domain-containing protein [Microbulbifer sp. VAAF005]|uniref:DUF6531 domain-containing protein n=1 Tax=Microbulbifer sp. VAAF005 TaxID=3034230 RepID=UPI0024AE5A40|nr:DUF6531 domain-containing protein [Microbulbifer sp. VAAF005]WHI46316.1 DUF6531 domain-containing protein [Microbulbifer sp. VAAF005]